MYICVDRSASCRGHRGPPLIFVSPSSSIPFLGYFSGREKKKGGKRGSVSTAVDSLARI